MKKIVKSPAEERSIPLFEQGVVGLDLSLRGAAMVYIPPGWRGDWTRVASDRCGSQVAKGDHLGHVQRIKEIVFRIEVFLTAHLPDEIFVEDYAFGLAGQSGMKLAELGGAVKHSLWCQTYFARPMNVSTARKYLLGKIPSGKGKAAPAVYAAMDRMGCLFETTDEKDAWVVANAGRAEIGLPGLTIG